MCYGVYLAAKKLKQYFREHAITMVSTAPLSEIMGNRDATGRIAKWSIAMADHDIRYEPRTAIKSQVVADFLVDWAETQFEPPPPDSTHWRIHFDGSKMRTGLGAGIILTSPKGDQLKYALQIHFAASNNVAEYEALAHGLRLSKDIGIQRLICFGDSDLVVQKVFGEWDTRDANMASYRFLIQQLSGPFEGCEFHHVPRADNEAADTLAKIASMGQAIPVGVSLEQLPKPSIRPSEESASIFVAADSSMKAPSAPPATLATAPVPATLALPTPIAAPAESSVQASSAPPATPATAPMLATLAMPTPIAAPATTTTPAPPCLKSCCLDT